MTDLSPTLQLAQDLIRRASVTPDDAGCQDLMIDRLQALGFTVHRLRFGTVDNFWAIRGEAGPVLAFAGHTDVVPTGPEARWQHPPFEPVIEDGYLCGRGAADMKGSLAAMITACEAFVQTVPEHPGRLALLITSDEEGVATDGTVKVVEWLQSRREAITWCVVGEPSSTEQVGDIIKNGRRGSLGAEMRVFGKQGHVAYPHLASNPIHQLAPALAELVSIEWDQGNEFFPATSLQVSNINSGTGATNVIPGEARVLFNFRFSTEVTAAQLQEKTEAVFARHKLNCEIDWNLSGEPFLTASGSLVNAARQAIFKVTGRETELSTAGGTSDGRFIAPTGAQVVEIGPVNATIHQVDERVKATDLDELSQIYLEIMLQLLGGPDSAAGRGDAA